MRRKRKTVLLHLRMEEQLFNGIIDECRRLGWRLINLAYTSDYVPAGRTYAGAIIDDKAKGHALDNLLKLQVPMVLEMDDERETLREVPRVLTDWHAVGRLAADAFTARGFKDIGSVEYIASGNDYELAKGLRDGARDIPEGRLHLCRVDSGGESKDGTTRYERHTRIISEWVKELPLPLGLLAFNHRMGARIITACEMAGLSVPEQVAVLSAGNQPSFCETAPVPLSAIDRNEERRGRELIRLLKRLVDGEEPPKDPILIAPGGIIERRSTDILAVPDPRVASAIRFMWDHLDWPITVDDVAMEVGMSRSSIERAFRRSINRGVIGELRRKRLERCKELLRGTTMTVPEITKAIGLTDKRYLQRAFKGAFGETLRQYRVRHKPANE